MVHIGIIGLGVQTKSDIIPALLRNQNLFTVDFICDVSFESLSNASLIFPYAKAYEKYSECLRNHPNLDFIFMSLPHNQYYPVITEVISYGIPVVKEKPFALNASQAQALYDLAIKNKVSIVTLMKRDYYPNYIVAKEMLPRLGLIYQYVAKHYVTGGNIHSGWKSKKEEAGGGVLINLGYHMLNVLFDFFGPFNYMNMFSSNVGYQAAHYEIEDAATMLLRHKNNIYGSFQINAYSGIKQESLEIVGSDAMMIVLKNSVKIINNLGKEIFDQSFDISTADIMSKTICSYISMDNEIKLENMKRHKNLMNIIDTLYRVNI